MTEPLVCTRCGSSVAGARCLKCGGSPVEMLVMTAKLGPKIRPVNRPAPESENPGKPALSPQPAPEAPAHEGRSDPNIRKDPSKMTTAERISDTQERIATSNANIEQLRTAAGRALGSLRTDVKTAQASIARQLQSELSQLDQQRLIEAAAQEKQSMRVRHELDREEMIQTIETANKVKQIGLRLRDVATELGDGRAYIATSDMTVNNLVPSTQVREFVTVGTMKTSGASTLDRDLPRVPALLPFVDAGHLIVESPSGTPDHPDTAFQGLLTSLVAQTYASVPGGQIVVTVFNPRSSKVLAGFRPTGAEAAGLLKVLSPTREALEKALEEHLNYTQRAESSIGTYSTLGELVRNTGQHEHQFHVLVILDGPSDWSSKSIDLLEKLMASGSKAGLSVLLHRDPTVPAPDRVDITRLYKFGSVLARRGREWLLEVPGGTAQRIPVEPAAGIPPAVQAKLMQLVVAAAKDGSLPSIPFEELAERTPGTSEHGLVVTMGKKGTQTTQFVLGDTVSNIQNVLIGGRAGSGKTNLLKVMIYSMAARYPREELELFLLDFKEGGDFIPFVGDNNHGPLPNATVVSRDCDAGFGLATLRHFAQEMRNRADLTSNNNVSNIWDLRARTGIALPRWVLVIDEFQGLFGGPTYQEATELLENFVRKGRSFGLHVILATQTLSGVKFAGDKDRAIFENISGRVVLQLGPGEFTRFMESGNDEDDQLRYRGQAIFNPMGGRKSENQLFVVARADVEHTNTLQDELYRAHGDSAGTEQHTPFVYRGDATVTAMQLLEENGAPKCQDGELPAWYGRETTINPFVATTVLSPIAGSHMLLLGGDETTMPAAIGTLQTAVLSAVAAGDGLIDVIVFEELIPKYRSGALIDQWLETLAVLGANVVRFNGATTEAFVREVAEASAARRRTIVAMLGAENSDFALIADDKKQWRDLVANMPRRNVNLIGHWSDLRDIPGDKFGRNKDYKTVLIFGKDEHLAAEATGRPRHEMPPMSNNRTVVFSATSSQDGVRTVTSLEALSGEDLDAFCAIARRPATTVRVGGAQNRTSVETPRTSHGPRVTGIHPMASDAPVPRKNAVVVADDFAKLIPQKQLSAADGARALLGGSETETVSVTLGGNGASNLLVSGWPTMGTGQAVERLIHALAAQHAPSELRIDLIDSDEAGDFPEITGGSHCRLTTANHISDELLIRPVLAQYVAEVERRLQLFVESGSSDYQDHRRRGYELSRWVLIWNAFSDARTPAITAQIERLAQHGPSVGLHLVLSAVAPISSHMPEMPQFFLNSGRLLLFVKPDESEALLGNDAAARLARRKEALIAYGPGQSATVFAVSTVEDEYLGKLRSALGGLT